VKWILISLARLYQRLISPLLPATCRYSPTCSQYFIDAVRRRGVVLGTLKGCCRVLRCNPFFAGGYDPVDKEQPMPFLQADDFSRIPLSPGVTIRAAGGEKVMLSFVHFEPQSEVGEHQHPHEQMGTVLEGRFVLCIEGESRVVRKGDCYLVPSNVPHSARTTDSPARALDVFAPPREDYRKQAGL